MYNFLYDLHIDDPGTCMTGTVYHMMVTGGINMIQTRECRYCVNCQTYTRKNLSEDQGLERMNYPNRLKKNRETMNKEKKTKEKPVP